VRDPLDVAAQLQRREALSESLGTPQPMRACLAELWRWKLSDGRQEAAYQLARELARAGLRPDSVREHLGEWAAQQGGKIDVVGIAKRASDTQAKGFHPPGSEKLLQKLPMLPCLGLPECECQSGGEREKRGPDDGLHRFLSLWLPRLSSPALRVYLGLFLFERITLRDAGTCLIRSTRDLEREAGVSRTSVRRAVAELAAAGLVRRESGRPGSLIAGKYWRVCPVPAPSDGEIPSSRTKEEFEEGNAPRPLGRQTPTVSRTSLTSLRLLSGPEIGHLEPRTESLMANGGPPHSGEMGAIDVR
jgi:hypothetical protein